MKQGSKLLTIVRFSTPILLYLSSVELGQFTAAKQQLAKTVAENIALALANLNLCQTLHNQSIRDLLTGLFNRRYTNRK
jgi:GAF domain-containing protein